MMCITTHHFCFISLKFFYIIKNSLHFKNFLIYVSVTNRDGYNNMKNLKFWIEKECKVCNNKFWSLIKRNSSFCSNKCSANFTANDINRINKIKQTKLKKYGSETFVNPEKAKQTNLERYGVDNPSKSEEIKEKIKQTNLEKYGVNCSWQNENIKEKIKQTNLEKYGVENASSSDLIKQKRKNVCVERYGVENVFENENIKKIIKSTNLLLYGAEYFSKTNKYKEIQIQNNINRFFNKIEFHKLNIDYIPLFSKEEYINTNKTYKYKFQCKKCNDIFYDHLDGGHLPRCLSCNPYIQGYSVGEKEILNYIKTLLPNIVILYNDRTILNGLELDIYIPDLKLAIEFDGLYWHSETSGNKTKEYHLNKTKLCNNLGIRLIHIFEDEWFYKQEIVKSRICYLLNKNDLEKIDARKCEVKEISYTVIESFLFENHLQGPVKSNINLGLYYNNKLVSVASFGRNRISCGNKIKPNVFELLRFCNLVNTNVRGGLSKIVSFFIKKYSPLSLMSYSDKRWNCGNSYEKVGFSLKGNTLPGYWYVKIGDNKRYHRFNFRKDQLSKKLENFNTDLSEWQNMQNNGWDRVWDCGNLKYEMSFS